jgi:hypothetical protein
VCVGTLVRTHTKPLQTTVQFTTPPKKKMAVESEPRILCVLTGHDEDENRVLITDQGV